MFPSITHMSHMSSYHLFCILDCQLSSLPHRRTDDAYVLDEQQHVFKRIMEEGLTKHIKRYILI